MPLKKIKITPLIITLLFFGFCKECPTEPKDPELYLTAPYVETSIVWLKVSSPDSTLHKSFIIQRDTVTIMEASFLGRDTIIADRNVQPNTSYTYTVNYVKNGRIQDQNASVTVTTLDISSSDFTWEVLYFGERSGDLNSVSIASENNIWAVGRTEVWGWDSLYSEYGWLQYNALHWDGLKWNMLSIRPSPWTYKGPFDVVHAISDSMVWIGIDAPALYLRGEWQGMMNAPRLGWMLDIWGNSLDNTFFTYYGGRIAHYDGTKFTVMNSGTLTDLHDIDGNDERVYIAGYSTTAGNERLILEYIDGSWKKVFQSQTTNGNLSIGDFGRFNSVKVFDNVAVIASAAVAMLKYYFYDGLVDYFPKSATVLRDCYPIRKIDGNAINDIAYMTTSGEIVHFNGQEYIQIFDYENQYSKYVSVYGGDFKGDVICAVGYGSGKGVVIIGRR